MKADKHLRPLLHIFRKLVHTEKSSYVRLLKCCTTSVASHNKEHLLQWSTKKRDIILSAHLAAAAAAVRTPPPHRLEPYSAECPVADTMI